MTVLFTDGDFRLVRDGDAWEHKGSFIQHHHPELDSKNYKHTSFDWGGWRYCFGSDGKCTHCWSIVPKAMRGLMELENWER